MSLFDDIYGSYILEDNMGTDDPDDNTQQDQDGDGGTDNQETDTQDAGTDDTPDDGGDDNADQDNQGDEYEMNDPENDDNQEGEDATDQDDDQGDEYEMNDPEDDTSEENTGDEGEEGGDGDEYEMNDPESDDSDTDDETEDPTDPSQKLKEIEKSIFDQLTPEQQKTKTAELKNLYTETYEKCQSIIDIVSGIEKAPNQARVYDYIVKNLVDLQKYIRDYLENLFDSKTYIENMTELQKYLAILDTINNVFAEMQKKSESDANK